jgi:lysyl endopeptidase
MSLRFLLSIAAFAGAFLAPAQAALEMPSRASESAYAPAERFVAEHMPAREALHLAAPTQKRAPVVDEEGRLRVATVRTPTTPTEATDWAFIPEGTVNRLRATSEGAEGLRVKLQLGTFAAPLEIRAQGSDGRVESMRVDPSSRGEVWTPWTLGQTQTIELFSPGGLAPPEVRVEGVLHFDESPFAKAAAASCTVPVSCTTNDSTLDAAISERKNSSIRLIFVENGGGFVCSATLVNTERFPAPYLLTANHCIATAATASSATLFYFYEPTTCADPLVNPGYVQQAGGTQLIFTNHNADSTLLLASQSPPPGALYAGWNAAHIADGEAMVSISHPRGDAMRLATGTMSGTLRITDRAQDEYGVTFSRGIIEGGSSGSGLFTLAGTSLQLRGVLTGTTIRNGSGMSCTNLNEQALYGRLDIFAPQMAQYLRASGPTPDDTPNRVLDWAGIAAEAPLNNRTLNFDRRLEFVGDVDVFRFRLDAAASVSLSTTGTLDTVGTLMDSNGKSIEANDDITFGNVNFGITRSLEAGTYYVMVAPWEEDGVGTYRLVMSATTNTSTPPSTGANYTDLWWNASEAGWGVNLAHQGDVVFATLYTYDSNGAPMWLFMSNGDKQTDGSYLGTLYRAIGPAFNAVPWASYTPTAVGVMRLTFSSSSAGVLTYTVNGISVTKNITRYQFSTPTTCSLTTADRAGASNYQDLWWNPSEAGWGVNVAHQGNALFATLYTYDLNGQGLWLSMSNGALVGSRTYSGTLYRSSGPAFNANPWGSYALQPVGTMTFSFSDGNNGTLTYSVNGLQVVKSIKRFVFSTPLPLCASS